MYLHLKTNVFHEIRLFFFIFYYIFITFLNVTLWKVLETERI